jgi:DNA helicase-2/ATP-dependent DNA helicase PcrA
VVLTQNYRSSVEILDAAYQLIQHNNPDRLETRLGINKQLQAQFAGSRPSFQPAADSRDEYQLVTSVIEAQLASGRKTDNIAVLSTTHGSLRSLARVLRQKHISYQLTSNLNVFEQPEIVQLWHLLRWIGLTQDDDAILQLLLGPFIEWSPEQVRQVAEPSKHELITLEEAITKLAASDNADALAVATNLVQWRSWAAELTVSQLVYKLIFESGLSDRWIAAVDDTPRLVHVFEDLQLWLRQMQEYETVALDPRLAGYLSTFPIPPEIETEVKTGDELGVKLLTIHASKGLEFETVIIMNNTQTAWSERNGGLQNQPPEELTSLAEKLPPEHERRRLLYVAMTRAKQELYFTAPTLQKGGRNRKLSPFLSEIFNETELKVEIDPVVQNNLQITLSNLQRYAPLLEQNTGIKLPFESSDGWLSLSATQVDAYERCAYEFYLLHVLKISLPLGPQLQFGSLLHGLFHRYYEAKLAGEPVTIQELQERLTEQWSDRGYPSVRAAELALSTARTTLQNFFDREEIEKRVIRSTEESIVLKIDEAKLRIEGRIDATFITDSGVEVRDFKTGRKHDPEKLANDAKASLQLRTYALAIEAMEGRAPTSVVLDYVVTGTEGRAELSATILKNHRAKLAGIAEKIRAGEFAPSTDAFHNCIVGKFWGNPDMEDDNA